MSKKSRDLRKVGPPNDEISEHGDLRTMRPPISGESYDPEHSGLWEFIFSDLGTLKADTRECDNSSNRDFFE